MASDPPFLVVGRVPGDGERHRGGRRLDPLGRLECRFGLDGAGERFLVGGVRGLELEREVVSEADAEQGVSRPALVADPLQEGHCAAIVLERLLVRVQRAGRVAGRDEVAGRLLRLVRLDEMEGEQTVDLLERVGVELLERESGGAVEVAAAALEEAAVGDFPQEAVPEPVLGDGATSLLDDQIEPLQVGEDGAEPDVGSESLEERHRERATDDGGDADEVAGVGCEPVEPRLQRLLDGRRERSARPPGRARSRRSRR